MGTEVLDMNTGAEWTLCPGAQEGGTRAGASEEALSDPCPSPPAPVQGLVSPVLFSLVTLTFH